MHTTTNRAGPAAGLGIPVCVYMKWRAAVEDASRVALDGPSDFPGPSVPVRVAEPVNTG